MSITITVISNDRRSRRVSYSTRTYEQVPYGVAAAFVGRLVNLLLRCALLRFVLSMRVTFNATAAIPAGSIRLANTIYEDVHLNMTGGWPEHECITLFRLTSNQIRSLSCSVSSRVSDDSGLRLSKTFITASNTWG